MSALTPKPVTPPALPAHTEFIRKKLPSWLTRANKMRRDDLRRSLIDSNQARHDLKALLSQLKSPSEYARPYFELALHNTFFGLLDSERGVVLREWKNHHLLGLIKTHARTTQQPLLEAALQNFEADEAEDGGMEAGSAIYNVYGAAITRQPISPIMFAGFCRSLDLGKHYLQHLETLLAPKDTPQAAVQVRQLFSRSEQTRFETGSHIAHLRGWIDQRLYSTLLALARNGGHPDLQCNHLTLGGVVLPSVLVIHDTQVDRQQLLYIPDDPVGSFGKHESMESLEHSLVQRLAQPAYFGFFQRLVPLRHQGTLLTVLPARTVAPRIDSPARVIAARLEAKVSRTLIQGDAFQAVAIQRIQQIRDDARTLAVPTADADALSRQKRLHYFAETGKSLLFFAASFIPIVGEVLLVVTAAQLVDSLYNGFAAWSRGDSDQALNDMMDVVDTVAQGVATAGAVKAGGFGARLIAVKVQEQGMRLWNPDMVPYRQLKTLPAQVPVDAQGLQHYEGQHYVSLDDHLHALARDPRTSQWRLQHPSDPRAYQPQMLSNDVGGWRQEHETARDWDDFKLIKRLGPDASNIKTSAVEPILRVSGADASLLRQAHQEVVRPPPGLRDTVRRFNLAQEIEDFNFARAEGSEVSRHSPLIQFHLLVSLPKWPTNRVLKVVDEQQRVLFSHGNQGLEITVPEARFRKGELLDCLEEQLTQAQFNELPARRVGRSSNVENLAFTLAAEAHEHADRVFTWLNDRAEQPASALEQTIRDILPGLSKYHLEEATCGLSFADQQRLQLERSLTAQQHWEFGQYLNQSSVHRAYESLYLKTTRSPDYPVLVLTALESLPGWPTSSRLEIREQTLTGPLLYSNGAGENDTGHLLVHEREQFTCHTAQGQALGAPADLLTAIDQSLSDRERSHVLRQSGVADLPSALRKASLELLAKPAPPRRAPTPWADSPAVPGLPFDPLFASPTPPEGLTLRADGVYQAPPLPDGSYRYYVLESGNYYLVKADALGWRLLDARSRFRAYQPYIGKNAEGGWQIDPQKDALLGGMPTPPRRRSGSTSSELFESADSNVDYESALESLPSPLPNPPHPYGPSELRSMRSHASYQFSQNYRGLYDRANNGRYPLRDVDGQPMRIKAMQSQGKSPTSGALFDKQPVLPYIQWEGYEKVAQLYDEKIEVVPFTQAQCRFAEESVLIGQSCVVSTKDLTKGEVLGVYGGGLLPHHIAGFRRDPYLIDVRPYQIPHETTASPINREVVLSGDNVLSRMNTIFDYEAGYPVRQASGGYNVEAVYFNVETQKGEQPRESLRLTAFFTREDICAGTELRWNYQYNEPTIRALFGPLPETRP
ncbi:hypothetical protein cym2001_07100 [Pseudomonas sp. CYM-20-01]|uniref:dermonecrotic toxin domain-containing protein n=1 Tax=Pseudomonas sp. CYM-20-01 TaxID=2870750 RepID=UPI00206EE5D9|nr:DUF6543 domain-containing protein [Pseudomonas sp. CYM-20-01]BDB17345.1 hypothetical protein cym2001_07100 [Pseudomonas sp. CYM-20-01]